MEVYMRQFYLYKNKLGYFVARFIDPVTGALLNAKSTHVKDKIEATMIAETPILSSTAEMRERNKIKRQIIFCFLFRSSNIL